jgi:AraC family transcriptional regulator
MATISLHQSRQCAEMVWSNGEASHTRLPPCSAAEAVSVSAPHGICLTFSDHKRCVLDIGGRSVRRNVPRGSVSINGPEPIVWLEVREPADVIEIVASVDIRRAIAEETRASAAAELGDVQSGRDPVIWAIAVRFRAAVLNLVELSDLERDLLLHQLYHRVFLTKFGGKRREKGDGGLDERRLQRVDAFIDANLASELSIADLAGVATLSRFHFLRSFKRATGLTPHQFVRGRRLEQARLEIDAGGNIDTVARGLGFLHRHHFRAMYQRHHGLALRGCCGGN